MISPGTPRIAFYSSDIALSQSSAYQHPNMNPATQPMMMHGRPALYKPSAPPPPLTVSQTYLS